MRGVSLVTEVSRKYIYILDGAQYAQAFYESFNKKLQERGNILETRMTKLSIGLFRKKERPVMEVTSSIMSATVTAMTVGPDLYVGYVVFAQKDKPNPLEQQDFEALSEYLTSAIKLTLEGLGAHFE